MGTIIMGTVIFIIMVIGTLVLSIYIQFVLIREDASAGIRVFVGIITFGATGFLAFSIPKVHKDNQFQDDLKKNHTLIEYFENRDSIEANIGILESQGWAPATAYATSNVNLRKGPGIKYDKIGLVKTSERVLLTSKRSNGWFQVNYNNKTGWIYGKYLRVKNDVDKKAIKQLLLKYFFPEQKIWKNILGILIGLIIGCITYLITVNLDTDVDTYTTAITFVYFLIKNYYYVEMNHTAQELGLLLLATLVWAIITSQIPKIIFYELEI